MDSIGWTDETKGVEGAAMDMIVALGDTHRTSGHGLKGRSLEAVTSADTVVHTGDFTTVAVFDAFKNVCERLVAVAGNNDASSLVNQLPSRTVFSAEGVTVALVHGHEQSTQALSLLGREAGADLVIAGHSHRPGVESAGDLTLLNPGSHAAPRQFRAAHVELERDGPTVRGRLVEPTGTVIKRFTIELGG